MEAFSNEQQKKLRKAIIDSVTKSQEEDFQVVTDIHLHVDTNTGILSFYDDDDTEITTVLIEEWLDIDDNDYSTEVIQPLQNLLHSMRDEHCFDNATIAKPFAFVLEDNEKETIEELLIVDDENVILTSELLKGLDSELDSFLEDLLAN